MRQLRTFRYWLGNRIAGPRTMVHCGNCGHITNAFCNATRAGIAKNANIRQGCDH